MPTTSFLCVLCLSQICNDWSKYYFFCPNDVMHVPCFVTLSIIPSLSILNILRYGGWQPYLVHPNNPRRYCTKSFYPFSLEYLKTMGKIALLIFTFLKTFLLNHIFSIFSFLVEIRHQWNTVWQDHSYSCYLYQWKFIFHPLYPFKSKRNCHL